MPKVNLSGDRLGSGAKMMVNLSDYQRSTHNLSRKRSTTIAPGTLVPVLLELGLNGDTFDINCDVDIMTHPTLGPLFGSYKVQLDVFQAPIRLYNALLHNNTLGIGLNMAQVKIPVFRLSVPQSNATAQDLDNSQINPSSILSYFGVRGVGFNGDTEQHTRLFNAIQYIS